VINFKKINKIYKKKEKDVYKLIRKHWRGYIERIEPKYRGGIPDVLMVNKQQFPFFLELKKAEREINSMTVRIKIRKSQILWFMAYPSKAFMLIELNEKFFVIDKINVPKLRESISIQELKDLASIETDQMNQVIRYLDQATSF